MSQITLPSTSKPQKSINIEFDSNFVINGITNMVESDDKQIICNMGETTLTISGDKLKISNLDTNHCVCSVSGNVHTLKYAKGRQKQSLIKKIFK